MRARSLVPTVLMVISLGGLVAAQDEELPLSNWSAPPYWNPTGQPRAEGEPEAGLVAHVQGMQAQAEALPSSPLPFVAIAPCRIVDTRVALDDGFHRPNFADDESRTFNLPASPDCAGLPATAGAWSVNIQFRPMSQLSFLTAYPTGTVRPGVSNMTASPAAWVQNAAIVPAGTSGAIDIYCQFAGRVIIDVNGYYGPQSVVTSLTGGGSVLTGDVTLLEGTNVTITPSGNTLMIAASGGPGGTLPAGAVTQTLFHDGVEWAAASNLYNTGTDVGVTGTLLFPATTSTSGQLVLDGTPFLHAFGTSDVFLGQSAGNFVATGGSNVGIGYRALQSVSSASSNVALGASALAADTTGSSNTAAGFQALQSNTSGESNTAVGAAALPSSTTGRRSTAVGAGALFKQAFDNDGTPWITDNTALGFEALFWNNPTNTSEAVKNTAVGSRALHENTTGYDNVAVGYAGLMLNTTGSANTAIGTNSLWQNNTGWYNTATGSHGLNSNTSGEANTANGYGSMAANQTGSSNTAVGAYALYANQDAVENTAAGFQALFLNDGSFNVAIGWRALADNQTGNGNVAIGHNSAAAFNGDNQLFIGNGLGNLLWGDFAAGRVAINGTSGDRTLVVYGDARVTSLAGIGPVCADADGVLGPCAPALTSHGAGVRAKAKAPGTSGDANLTASLVELTRTQRAEIGALKAANAALAADNAEIRKQLCRLAAAVAELQAGKE